jgi:methionyl aminopeptidase
MIILKTEKEIEIMRQGGKRLAGILHRIGKVVRPGVTTAHLERLACELIDRAGGKPSFKGYQSKYDKKPYPTALCISVNDEVVHAPALPTRILREGDIVGIDVGMRYPAKEGYYTDMAETFAVGKVSPEAKKLLEVTKKCLKLAIKTVKPNSTLNDIGRAVETYVLENGFSVVRDLVGHGVGTAVHEEPNVPNFSFDERADINLKPGMVLAIEPMVNAGGYQVFTAPDGMTIKTHDGSLSAHFEHTVAVTKRGHKILTE